MSLAGLIFADAQESGLGRLLNERTQAAVPFGARYRLIDFALSNLVNANIQNVGIILKQNYHSLMNHVTSGSAWDLDRKNGGLQFLPPFATADNTDAVYKNRLEGLIANRTFLKDLNEDYILFTNAGYAANLDYAGMLDAHIRSGARATVMYVRKPAVRSESVRSVFLRVDREQRVTDLDFDTTKQEGMVCSLESYIFNREELIRLIDEAVRMEKRSLRKDIIVPMIASGGLFGYEAKTSVLFIDSLQSYLEGSLALLEPEVRSDIFESENGPIITKIKDSAPAKYGAEAVVSNSLIASGAVVEGTVRNSVIFRGVRVEKGAEVDHCVLMQNAVISEGSNLSYAILDKNSFVEKDRKLAGYLTHPFMLDRGERI